MDKKCEKKLKKTHFCERCNFTSNNKTDYDRHCKTKKHIYGLDNLDNKWITEKTRKNASPFSCDCGRKYKFQSGLCKHKKTCVYIIETSNNLQISMKDDFINNLEEPDYKTMFFKLMQENKDFKNILVHQQMQIGQLIPRVGNNTVNNVNNVNQKLNINIFLNEQCKDALNIDDFVKNIELDLNHLDYTTNKGLTEGITNAIITNMNKLSLYERPLHCTDIKRETLYIKENDNWEKDNNKVILKKAIKDVSKKQFSSIKKWTDENPDFQDDDTKQEYFAKVLSVLGKDISTVDDKIIKKICNHSHVKNLIDK
jgi:hypothetical protein